MGSSISTSRAGKFGTALFFPDKTEFKNSRVCTYSEIANTYEICMQVTERGRKLCKSLGAFGLQLFRGLLVHAVTYPTRTIFTWDALTKKKMRAFYISPDALAIGFGDGKRDDTENKLCHMVQLGIFRGVSFWEVNKAKRWQSVLWKECSNFEWKWSLVTFQVVDFSKK